MTNAPVNIDSERKGETKLEAYRLAIQDAQHVFNAYGKAYPAEAWETLRRIIFDKKLK